MKSQTTKCKYFRLLKSFAIFIFSTFLLLHTHTSLAAFKPLQGPHLEQKQKIRNYLKFGTGVLYVDTQRINKPLLRKIYEPRSYAMIWLKGNKLDGNYEKALKLLSRAEFNGLEKSDFLIDEIKRRVKVNDGYTLGKTDILITQMIVNFISQTANGKGVPENSDIEFFMKDPQRISNFFLAIEEFLGEDNVSEYIERYSPRHEQYKNLKKALAKLIKKKNQGNEQKFVKDGPDIKQGMSDFRIPIIKDMLDSKPPISPKAANDKFYYDRELFKEVIKFQKKHGLNASGIIARKTVAALNMTVEDKINKVKANMERYRWLPDNLEKTRIMVNIPEYKLKMYRDDKLDFKSTVIVGREEKKTPIINTVMNEVVFHPYWHVPKNYSLNQLLPHIRNDEYYLYDEEFTVIEVDENGGWNVVDPAQIDWFSIGEDNFDYIIRQDPGNKNALGPIKFNIKNDLSIYLHGTTEPWLFDSPFRAHSSGCVRVERPLQLAYEVLINNSPYSKNELERLYHAYDNDYEIPYDDKPKHITIKLYKEIPTYLVYFTVFADSNGDLTYISDIYNWDNHFRMS